MPKPTSAIIRMLQDIAAREADAAAQLLAAAQQQLAAAEQNHRMLQQYHDDYVSQRDNALATGLPAELYGNYQNFIGRLAQAIVSQTETVAQAGRLYAQRQQEWQAAQQKKLSFEVLSERDDKRVQHAALKVEQKMMDEYAMRARPPLR